MKKLILLPFLFLGTLCFGQFSFDAGVTLLLSGNKTKNFNEQTPTVVNGSSTRVGDTSFYAYKYSAAGIGLFLYPKYQFMEFGDYGLAVGAPISIALPGNCNSQTGCEGSLMTDLNLTVDLLGGSYNKKSDDDASLGYYVGLGYGVTNTDDVGLESVDDVVTSSSANLIKFNGRTNSVGDYLSAKSSGLLLHAGVGNMTFLEDVSPLLSRIGIRFGYRPSLNKDNLSYFTGSLYLHW